MEQYRCACSFGKAVDDQNPTNFPRIGISHNVLLRGHWIIEHRLSGRRAVIMRPGEPPLHAEATDCCFVWFSQLATDGGGGAA